MRRCLDALFKTARSDVRSLLILMCMTSLAGGCVSGSDMSRLTAPCHDSISVKVSRASSTVSISYLEPSQNAAGKPLDDLAKTSIYYDKGAGRILAKEVPATKPAGGGQISETVSIPMDSDAEQTVAICVTASDHHGNESATSP